MKTSFTNVKGTGMISKKMIHAAIALCGLVSQAIGQVQSLKGRELYVPGEILVRLKEGVSSESRVKALAVVGEAKVLSQPDLFKIKLKGNLDVLQAVARVKNDPSVLSAQPNYRYYALAALLAPAGKFFFPPHYLPFFKIQAV